MEELWGRHVAHSELSERARRQLKKEMIESEGAVFIQSDHVHCRRCGSVTTAKFAQLPFSADAKPHLVWAVTGAVVMIRFYFGSIGADMQSVAAYGTTVKYK